MKRFNIYQTATETGISFIALEVGGGITPADTDVFCAEVTEDVFPYQIGIEGDKAILLELPN